VNTVTTCILLLWALTAAAVEGQPVTLTEEMLDRAYEEVFQAGRSLPGWRYRGGDDPEWSRPDLDDSDWQPVTFGQGVRLPDWEGVGWLRTQLTIPDGVAGDRLVLIVSQVGAADVYLDGNKIAGIGRADVTSLSSREVCLVSPGKLVPMNLSTGTHTIAIRHTNWWAHDFPWIASTFTTSGEMLIGVGRYDDIVPTLYRIGREITTVQMLWSVPFALIHYLIYLFNRKAREHLDIGLFAESIAGMVFFPFQAGWSDSIWLAVITHSLFRWSLVCSALFGLRFCHRVFDGKILNYNRTVRVLIYTLCALVLVVPLQVYYVVCLTGFLAMAGIVIRALFRRKEGALIVTIGILVLTVSCGFQILMETRVIAHDMSFPYIYGVLFLTLTMSIHLARSYARTHNNLAFQIEQIETLTDLTVRQEREAREREARVREREAERKILEAESAFHTKELEEAKERQRVLEELESSSRELREAQSRLVETERMAAVGNLVAGIAHEINTPVGAIYSSHDTFVRAVKRLKEEIPSEQLIERTASVLRVIGEANRVITTATRRVTEIVRSLRNFARLDEAEMKRADVHEGLDSTLTLVRHNLKNRIKVTRSYGDIPEIVCFPSRLNQVFLNILTNASQAIAEEGEITIRTSAEEEDILIEFEDSGDGIDEEHLLHVFESGFTTKTAGAGTGLGLAISKQIIDDHHGRITVESVKGQGTTFRIRLPIEGARPSDNQNH